MQQIHPKSILRNQFSRSLTSLIRYSSKLYLSQTEGLFIHLEQSSHEFRRSIYWAQLLARLHHPLPIENCVVEVNISVFRIVWAIRDQVFSGCFSLDEISVLHRRRAPDLLDEAITSRCYWWCFIDNRSLNIIIQIWDWLPVWTDYSMAS